MDEKTKIFDVIDKVDFEHKKCLELVFQIIQIMETNLCSDAEKIFILAISKNFVDNDSAKRFIKGTD